jgi:hypothetical protein
MLRIGGHGTSDHIVTTEGRTDQAAAVASTSASLIATGRRFET